MKVIFSFAILASFCVLPAVFQCVEEGYDPPLHGQEFRERYEDAFLDSPDLIKKYGYPFEGYNVTTEDGYILVIHRIPANESCEGIKGAVLLVHGMWQTSSVWLEQGPGRAFPYLLSDECYDVWLPNLRGNYYSKYHQTLSNNDTDFWEFTIQEVAIYDIPAVIELIVNTTGENKIFYFGIAYGNTVFYVLMSEKPEYNDKVRLHVSYGPSASLSNLTDVKRREEFTVIAEMHEEYYRLGVNEIMPKTEQNYNFSETTCQPNTPQQIQCMQQLFWFVGYNYEQVNKTQLPVHAGQFPAGIGRNILIQLAQSLKYRDLRKFDYGPEENQERYDSDEPPEYHWERITSPVIFYQGDRDTETTATDSKALYDKLPNGIEYKFFNTFIHIDFAIGVDSTELVYKPIMEVMEDY